MTEDPSNKQALIKYRMERAHQTLRAAQLLNKQNEDPASVVNRAYYAMFYAALALLATIGEETSKYSGVMALFDKHFIKSGILPKEMGKFLHMAFDMRQTGDYEDKVEVSKEASQQVLEFAEQFINSIEEKLSI